MTLFLIFITSGLTGCEQLFPVTVKEICEDYPSMCADLNSDGWCRAEKSEIIKHRYHYRDDKSERPKYYYLLKLENYQSCINKAALIVHKKYREREFDRKEAAVSIVKELKKVQWQTRHSPDPYVAYYQWSRFGYDDAKQTFMDAANAGQITSPKMYVALAGIQVKDDAIGTRNTLYKALAAYADSDEELDNTIFNTLTALNLDMENYNMAYVWAKVANHFNDDINDSQEQAIAQQYNLSVDLLNALSDEIIDAISAQEFDAKALKIDRL